MVPGAAGPSAGAEKDPAEHELLFCLTATLV